MVRLRATMLAAALAALAPLARAETYFFPALLGAPRGQLAAAG